MPPPIHQGSHIRKYLLIITLIVGGFFLLLLMNNDHPGGGITSAVIENVKNSSLGNVISGKSKTVVVSDNVLPSSKSGHHVDFTLTSNTIPIIEKEVTISQLSLHSTDVSPRIKVNGDNLELGNIKGINFNIADFNGRVSVDDVLFSLDGSAKRLEVNGIALASDKQISISFQELEYQQASFEEIALDVTQFVSGTGNLKVSDGLEYKLEEGQSITIYQYLGNININKGEDNNTIKGSLFEGSSDGVDIIGKSLNLNLR